MDNELKFDYSDWWVVQVKAQAEIKVIRELENQGFNAYCPMYQKESLKARQIKIKTFPLFPRYVFILANHHAKNTIHAIRSTYGVSLLLKVGEVPTTISNQIIKNLRVLEALHMNVVEPYYKKGEVVKITKGLYQGLKAIYQMEDGLERVTGLLNILKKEVPLHLKKHQLSKV